MPSSTSGREVPQCPACPLCGAEMELVYYRSGQQVCVCSVCHTGLTIPSSAWDIKRRKQDGSETPD